ncbi:hypothetical protein D3C73_1547650 [compost metagenome]
MMHSQILGKLQRQEKIRIICNLFYPGKCGIDRFDTVFIRLDTLKTPVRHWTELAFLIDYIMYSVGEIG